MTARELAQEMTNDEAAKIIGHTYISGMRAGKTQLGAALYKAIEALQERKTGKWLDTADEYDKKAQKHDYFCLECKTLARDFICGSEDWWCFNPPKYCPNCGAKMEVSVNENGIQ